MSVGGIRRLNEKLQNFVVFSLNVSSSVLILGISKSGGHPPPMHKMWGRG